MWNPFAAIADIQATVHDINTKAARLMSQQDDLAADVQAINQAVTDLGAAAAAIEAEITALKASNPALDLGPLDAAVGSLKTAVSGVADIAPPAP